MATMPRTLTTISANSAKHNGPLIQSDRLRVPELKAVKGDDAPTQLLDGPRQQARVPPRQL